jgi:hypothetical protein
MSCWPAAIRAARAPHLKPSSPIFGPLKPTVTLISVIEDVGSSTAGADDMFREQYKAQKAGAETAAAELVAARR